MQCDVRRHACDRLKHDVAHTELLHDGNANALASMNTNLVSVSCQSLHVLSLTGSNGCYGGVPIAGCCGDVRPFYIVDALLQASMCVGPWYTKYLQRRIIVHDKGMWSRPSVTRAMCRATVSVQ